jgi:hypothetical protein
VDGDVGGLSPLLWACPSPSRLFWSGGWARRGADTAEPGALIGCARPPRSAGAEVGRTAYDAAYEADGHGGSWGAQHERDGVCAEERGLYRRWLATAPGSPDGRLEPDAIQAVVRADFDRMRECYEIALSKKPNLQGRVTSKFLIDRNGAVARVADGGSDLPDHGVVQCVLREFGSLKFPHPDGEGGVVVVYPIMFNPAD